MHTKPIVLTSLLFSAVVAGCGTDKGDLTVTWTLNGAQLPSSCDTPGVQKWHVQLVWYEGRNILDEGSLRGASLDRECTSLPWSTGQHWFGMPARRYEEVSVKAMDKNGCIVGTKSWRDATERRAFDLSDHLTLNIDLDDGNFFGGPSCLH